MNFGRIYRIRPKKGHILTGYGQKTLKKWPYSLKLQDIRSAIYAKNEQENITPDEKKQLKAFTNAIKRMQWEDYSRF